MVMLELDPLYSEVPDASTDARAWRCGLTGVTVQPVAMAVLYAHNALGEERTPVETMDTSREAERAIVRHDVVRLIESAQRSFSRSGDGDVAHHLGTALVSCSDEDFTEAVMTAAVEIARRGVLEP